MIKEEMTTAAVGTNLGNGKDSPDNSKPKKKPKTAFSKIVRNPAIRKVSKEEYFPQPASNKKKLKKSLGGGPLDGSGLGESLDKSLQRVKFVYTGKKSTIPNPEVMVLDPNYDGREHWKNYGKKDYVLGYSLSHVSNKNEAIRNINDITDFTTLLGSDDDKEFYDRIKQLFPEQATFIRAYKKGNIVEPKILDDNDNEVPVKLIDLKSARSNGF